MGIQIKKQESIPFSPSLRQLNGFGKGRVFELSGNRVSIGRSDENQIVLSDESVSRVHALIEMAEDGSWVLLDNQSRNGVVVNGRKVEAYALQGNEQIQIGNIAFQLFLPDDSSVLSTQVAYSQSTSRPIQKSVFANRRVLIYGSAGLIFLIMYLASNSPTEDSTQNPKGDAAGTKAKVVVSDPPKPPIDTVSSSSLKLDPTVNPIESELEKLPWNDSGVTESEAYFKKGQREFFNKNYQRAINAFELALSLNQNHPAAAYYLSSAIHESEREASKNFETGLKYFEALQYRRAIYHFQQVQALLGHKPKDSALTEAEKYIRLSRQRLQAAELFP